MCKECDCCKKLAPILMRHLSDYAEMLRTVTELIANIRVFMEQKDEEIARRSESNSRNSSSPKEAL